LNFETFLFELLQCCVDVDKPASSNMFGLVLPSCDS
jgi:hypothetical protein